jgi:hypothetical protein
LPVELKWSVAEELALARAQMEKRANGKGTRGEIKKISKRL